MVLALGLLRGHNQPVHQAGLSDGSKDSCPISSVWMLAGSLNGLTVWASSGRGHGLEVGHAEQMVQGVRDG